MPSSLPTGLSKDILYPYRIVPGMLPTNSRYSACTRPLSNLDKSQHGAEIDGRKEYKLRKITHVAGRTAPIVMFTER